MIQPFPDRKYGAIYADPPWNFETRNAKAAGRSPSAHYDCMTFADIAKLPVADIAAKDCALFLWAMDPMLDKALEVIQAWGFTYKTVGFYWVKTNKNNGDYFTGMGHWTRSNPEQCLLATRGRPKRIEKSVRKLIVDKRREHSRKPDEVRNRIERLVGGPYIELFARAAAPGWDAWGNQASLFDNGSVETRRVTSSGAMLSPRVGERVN